MRDLAKADRLVAEKVMGWVLTDYYGVPASTPEHFRDAANNDGWAWSGRDGDSEACSWRPSSNISDAWAVVEKMRELGYGYLMTYPSAKSAVAVFLGDHDLGDGESDSAPLAICLAALKALGVEVGDE